MAYCSSQYTAESDASSTSSSSPTLDNRSITPSFTTAYNSGSVTEDVFRDVVKCRKSWKTLKGGKVVWPLHLEAALLEGLALYQPDNSRETLLLGRFPMRNRFISEHILRTTGEVRTAKQVGSRLQQLRDTCGGGKKLQKLLSPVVTSDANPSNRSNYRRYDSSMPNSPGSSSTPVSPLSMEDSGFEWNSPSSPNVIYIDITSNDAATSSPVAPSLTDLDYSDTLSSFHGPRPIRYIKPCLAFVSKVDNSVLAHSRFVLYHGDTVYEDQSPLTEVRDQGAPVPEGAVVYMCDLIPKYWSTVCNSADPTKFTIHHSIVRETAGPPLFSATYKFRYIPEKTLHSPTSPFNDVNCVNPFSASTFRHGDYDNQHCFNLRTIPGTSSSYEGKNWDNCLSNLAISSEQRGFTSLPATPCWDDYGIDGSCSSSSSPTTSNFPHRSQFI